MGDLSKLIGCLVAAGLVAGLLASPARGGEPGSDAEFFEKKIRPVLVEQCYLLSLRGGGPGQKARGGLRLDSRDGLRTGGDSGPVVIPGKPAESLLLQTLHYAGDVKMPPKGKLPDAVIADFDAWVKMGAPDPRGGSGVKKQVGLSLEEGRKFWAYRPVANPPLPTVMANHWPANDIDRFILAGLEEKGFRPAEEADRATLARRLYFDLIGLPPSPEEMDAFLKASEAKPQAAYEELVDRLLASPAFGERWGRHWLDVARFAESVTLRGFVFKEAWRYRDYVIDAFNSDVPFDRFIREQIAGDLLPAASLRGPRAAD